MSDLKWAIIFLAVIAAMSFGSLVAIRIFSPSGSFSEIKLERLNESVVCAKVLINGNDIFSCWKEPQP